jgi:hypothetical protein
MPAGREAGRRHGLLDRGEAVGQDAMARVCLRPGGKRLAHAGGGIQALLREQADRRGRRLGPLDRAWRSSRLRNRS